MAHLHHHNLLHLDLRPANVLISDNVPRLVDFGLAKWADAADVENWYGPHAAPELVEAGRAEHATDIYAMAMTLAHLLTAGSICHPHPTGRELIEASVDGDWPRLHELPDNIPKKLRGLIARATDYKTASRPQSAVIFKRELDKVTPATSFYPPDPQGELQSSDGVWCIRQRQGTNAWSVEVLRAGRRRNDLGWTGASSAAASKQVGRIVQQFADGRI